jgi:hypothetical protein
MDYLFSDDEEELLDELKDLDAPIENFDAEWPVTEK